MCEGHGGAGAAGTCAGTLPEVEAVMRWGGCMGTWPGVLLYDMMVGRWEGAQAGVGQGACPAGRRFKVAFNE
ncbi:hypothetical protein HaLaN_09814 [Haematococcus lacustris]|uniref:Uncharacterized protein n=1 Tax=Haematococcus lacustris TaxID=44745 RepID=A0A699Z398_HAELA|nr:hypothetical protein HaLaN_09814 [Haematococcus lacustris]